jgi:hypothetical protein
MVAMPNKFPSPCDTIPDYPAQAADVVKAYLEQI